MVGSVYFGPAEIDRLYQYLPYQSRLASSYQTPARATRDCFPACPPSCVDALSLGPTPKGWVLLEGCFVPAESFRGNSCFGSYFCTVFCSAFETVEVLWPIDYRSNERIWYGMIVNAIRWASRQRRFDYFLDAHHSVLLSSDWNFGTIFLSGNPMDNVRISKTLQ